MAPKILMLDNPLSAMDIARELAPSGFDTVIARAGSAEFNAALAEAEYIVGLGEVKMDDAFYKSAPNLRLVQLLSAGYDVVVVDNLSRGNRHAGILAREPERRRQAQAPAATGPLAGVIVSGSARRWPCRRRPGCSL